MSFIHLHNHTHFSILEGLPKPKDYIKKAKELGMEAIAITDTSNLHGAHEFYKICKAEGIKPILGTEIFVESSLDPKINHKLVLLAKNLRGHKNIIELLSKANLDPDNIVPKIHFDDFSEFSEDVICLSGPISGEIPFYILSGKTDEQILSRIDEYKKVFGEENYFLELIYHDDIPKQKLVTDKLIEISQKNNIQVVATNTCYYVEKEDKETQDVIKALGTGHELENPDRPTLINGDYSFLSEEEMQMLFGFIPEALENTKKIADMVDIEIETGGILIPTFELPEEHNNIYLEALKEEKQEYYKGEGDKEQFIKKLDSSEWYLRYLSFKGLNWRFGYTLSQKEIFELIKKLDKPSLDKKLTQTTPEELKGLSKIYYSDSKKEFLSKLTKEQQSQIDRLEYELVVIHEMGFDAYFLIVADYINWARDNDCPVGPGRGSAAGSLMAYLSGITDIDPLAFDLLFERFLNPARVSMPDIDTDFADTERDRVVEYCRNKYGADKVAQICTFGTFAARAAVKDVGRVYGIPFADMNRLAALIPDKPGTKLAGALEDSVEFAEAYEQGFHKDNHTGKIVKFRELIDNALKIEGNVRQLGVHACAVIIAPESMLNFTPLQHPPKDKTSIVTQYSAYPLEDLGLLKMDFLGLRNLTIIKRALKIILSSKGDDFDILSIDMNEQKVLDVFGNGDTTGVFQFESDGMRKYLKDLKPSSFEDLIAMVSLYRPGPLAYIPAFIDRKYGREEIKYMTDDLVEIMKKAKYSDDIIQEQKEKLEGDLKPILDVTYGIAVYQEQLMFIVQYMAGFSLGEADLLRRGIGKKKIEVIEQLKGEFIEKGEVFKGYKPEVTKYIYEEMIQPAANYSFNKSHAACYAYISYQTAYLKAHYETEFLTSIMVADEENMERIVMEVEECEAKGINVLPSSVNESLKHFTYIDDKNIRFGLKAIKGIGDGPINRILEVREELGRNFDNLEEFIESCGTEVINKRSLEALIKSGAMDELGERGAMFASIPDMIKFAKKDEKKKDTAQIGLFDNSDVFEDKLELIEVKDMSFEEKLSGEKEMIGFWVSGHPLDGIGRYCTRRSNNTKKLKMSFEELAKLPEYKVEKAEDVDIDTIGKEEDKKKKDIKAKKKEQPKQEMVQAVGVIVDVRKIITKTGKPMMFFKCEGFDYDFEVVVFAKDFETYAEKIEVDKIVIVNGALNVNIEFARKGIQVRDLKIARIGQVREQAIQLGLYDEKIKRFKNKDLNKALEEDENCKPKSAQKDEKCEVYKENFEEKLDDKIIENKLEKKEKISALEEFIVIIPDIAKKEDLHDLKAFLKEIYGTTIKVFIDLRGQKIDTKISIDNIEKLENWINSKW